MNDDQMKFAFMAEGGMIDDGKDVEPTTGNEVPPGSLSKEVKDHVKAKLSPGEYVLPADVVQFYGLEKIEKLVDKAKGGLEDLDSRGRIGGDSSEDDMEEEDDLPFGVDELSHEDEEDELEFAEGGAVPTPQAAGMHQRTYIDPQGNEHQVLFIGNNPLGFIDSGWRLKTAQEAVTQDVSAPTNETVVEDTGNNYTKAEEAKSPSDWTPEDFQKWDPSGSPLGPVGSILGGLGAGGGLISLGINAIHQGTVNRAYEELQSRIQNPQTPPEEKSIYEEQLSRYKTAVENPTKREPSESKGLLGNLFGGDGLIGKLFGSNTTEAPASTTATPSTGNRTSTYTAPAGLGGTDTNSNYTAGSQRPQARPDSTKDMSQKTSVQQTAAPAVKNNDTRYEDAKVGAYSQYNTNDPNSADFAGRMYAKGGLVARPKKR